MGGVVGLVSMPWAAAAMPSIQLATLGDALRRAGIAYATHSLYLDYSAAIGPRIYDVVGNSGGFVEEWLFARHYFGHETGDTLESFLSRRPPLGLGDAPFEEAVLGSLAEVTDAYLDEVAARPCWADYDVVGFSITISQTAASMALARLLKRRFPDLRIVFGGSSCAGPMGAALMRICPYVDVVVSVEGEGVLPALVEDLRAGRLLPDVPGVLHRTERGDIRGTTTGPVQRRRPAGVRLDYDEYFRRVDELGLQGRFAIWLPFESSRGCWWGEKHQCTFCGLHEIMQFRGWPMAEIEEELRRLAERYGIPRFFAVDLIMPREAVTELLPALARDRPGWLLFYEMKANVHRADLELMAAAGVRWVQPGIESLDDGVLRLMNKGVTALQNVQVLKWCQELGIRVTWNLITGCPGEDPAAYLAMAQAIPGLHHLPPPSGATRFQLHRFSPYFERPAEFGIRPSGAHHLYEHVFPVHPRDRDDLVYLHEYTVTGPAVPASHVRALDDAVRAWRTAHDSGARLELVAGDNGTAEIHDARSAPVISHRLVPAERTLYRWLDPARREVGIAEAFGREHPSELAELGGACGVEQTLFRWRQARLLFPSRGRLFALATSPDPAREGLAALAGHFAGAPEI